MSSTTDIALLVAAALGLFGAVALTLSAVADRRQVRLGGARTVSTATRLRPAYRLAVRHARRHAAPPVDGVAGSAPVVAAPVVPVGVADPLAEVLGDSLFEELSTLGQQAHLEHLEMICALLDALIALEMVGQWDVDGALCVVSFADGTRLRLSAFDGDLDDLVADGGRIQSYDIDVFDGTGRWSVVASSVDGVLVNVAADQVDVEPHPVP